MVTEKEKKDRGKVWLGDRFQGGSASEAGVDSIGETAGRNEPFFSKRK